MQLAQWGWNNYFSRALAALSPELAPARVVRTNRGVHRLRIEGGETDARLSGGFRERGTAERPVTGDWVAVDPARRLIAAVLPRRTRISRKKAGRGVEEQVLAANVDVVFVVTALDGDFNLRRLERYLLLANESGAAPVIVLNKSDLCDAPVAALRQADRIAPPGTPVLLMSALEPGSVAQLSRHVEPGHTAVLVGSSGVGKSTILNRLLGAEVQTVRAVRAHDRRGRHATTSRELFLLGQGWLLIDTPGLRELEPWAGPESVEAVFCDIEALAVGCRFRDCRHDGEPGCAVAQAIRQGALDAARLESLRKLEGELDHLRRMEDERAAQEHKKRMKRLHRALRNMPLRW
ncbi:MAG: ribosome small subunit-dependent GTPase A [Acidobacteriota bacterium]